MQNKQTPTRESTTFVNKLVEVLFEAWKNAEVFHKLIADVSYVPLNRNRDKSLGEIKIEGLKLEGKAPELLKLYKTKDQDLPFYGPADPTKKTFCYDAELNFQGKVKLQITTSYKVNFMVENWYNIPIRCEIVVGRISGKLRF